MKNHKILWTLFIAAILFWTGRFAGAAEKAAWQNLFDGKTLDGWAQLNGTAKYAVEEGCIVGTTVVGSPNSFLCTKKNYGNFILEVDFKVDQGLNSGIQIRSQSLKEYKDGRVHGYQVEIDPSPRAYTGGIYDEARRGWLCNLAGNEAARKAFKLGEWNHFRVEAAGDSMRVWLNGVPAAGIVDSMTPNGFIALQVHQTKTEKPLQVRWKNIRLQDLGVNNATPDAGDLNMGDWQPAEGGPVAQVFPLGAGKFQANLLKKFDVREDPVAVLEGAASGEKIVFSGGGWSAEIAAEHFKGQKGSEKFDMRRVTRPSPTLNALPPKGALVLFDGTNLDQWQTEKNEPAAWKIIPGGRLEIVPGAGSIVTKKLFTDFNLHVEFRTPVLAEERGQARANSGIYILNRYELQILDSYGLAGDNNECGAIYKAVAPRVHMAAPPLQWQTYDIDFQAARFDAQGKKTQNAVITVVHNGVTIHDRLQIEGPTGAAQKRGESPGPGVILLQDHKSPVQFRNIWIVDKAK